MKHLDRRVAVVTGGSGGIGRAVALALADAGCDVALGDLDGPGMIAVADEVRERGRRASTYRVDVADRDAVCAFADAVAEHHGGADILVNNAGVTVYGAFEAQTPEDVDWILGINLRGVLHSCHSFLPLLRRGSSGGHIVNMGSLAGLMGFPMQTTYCATKFAVRGFSAALRAELAGAGIGVTVVMPGAVQTAFMTASRSYDTDVSGTMARLMLDHALPPERVAAAVLSAVRRNRAEVVLGPDGRLGRAVQRWVPSLGRSAMSAAFRRWGSS